MLIANMLKKIYFSPIGYLASVLIYSFSFLFKPFMIYGYWNSPNRKFYRSTRISSTAVLLNKKNINIGDYCWVWHNSILDGSNGIVIGEGVQIGAWVGIFTHGSEISIRLHGKKYINVDKSQRVGYTKGRVEIGDYSFVGAGACILPGVVIGKGCLISAGAVVNKSAPDFSVLHGNPARIIGNTFDLDKKFFDDPDVRESYFDQAAMKDYLSSMANDRASGE